MWPDNEADRDFLNFSGVADTVAEIVVQARGRPISIGVSGAWGTGKSTMIKLTREALEKKPKEAGMPEFVFVEFNAWLYQGYDDARAALMDVIASKLQEEAQQREKGLRKAIELVKRVRLFRLAKLVAAPALAMLGVNVGEATEALGRLLSPNADSSPPKEIQALRDDLEATIKELGVTLVVLIDDLDRCLPETTISTLEAIRLFLFLQNTAFVIAADNEMIKFAVRKHFLGIDDNQLVTNYFDKLIQVPIRVPPLGTQEVRAYMMLLFVENSGLDGAAKERIRLGVCQQLRQTWQGKRVDRAFVQALHGDLPGELVGKLDTADRLAPIMTTAAAVVGNPRLIKRFLNALAIRMTISKAQGVGVDEAVLAKMLLFERLGDSTAHGELIAAVSANDEGMPLFLSEWEDKANKGEELELKPHWQSAFVKEWLALPPRLAGHDLRGALYVSREHAPLISPADRLSSDAADVLVAILQQPDMANSVKDRLLRLPRTELAVIVDRLLDRARQVQEWGVPPILDACLVVSEADPAHCQRLAAFLVDRPAPQIRPNIVPKIGDRSWAGGVFDAWSRSAVSGPVKNAIKQWRERGNVSV